ncbi:LysR family transcriptional regulator [Bradyrhizobium sp. STM 3562]|uniref:LysR family transcriptional regulator n=1 Tax=Bradyrhizobium sp. STM 3562 TaxID=578924 RepID=UPI0038910EE7
MRFKGLDLNLLVALDALMTERNLTAAARRINLSQPAMSAAVARLRDYFGDTLFTMRGRELVPTARAEGLSGPIREALSHIQLSIISPDGFDPAQSTRVFKIILSDFMTVVFFKKIVDRLAREAPGVSFELLLADEPDELLRRAEVDFLIFPDRFMTNLHPKATLFEDRFVCVTCRNNKHVPGELTFDDYMSMGHVVARFGSGIRPNLEEWLFIEHGWKIRTDVAVQGFTMIPPMLWGTDRIAAMPSRLARLFAKTTPLRILEPPLPLPDFTESVQWPALHNSDPGSIWLRQIFLEEASCMDCPRRTTESRKQC